MAISGKTTYTYNNYPDLFKHVKRIMKPVRYRHVINSVGYGLELCRWFALSQGIRDRFTIAALFHDLAKDFSNKQKNYYIKKCSIDSESKGIKAVWHGFIAAHILEKERELCTSRDLGKQDVEQDKSSVRGKPRR